MPNFPSPDAGHTQQGVRARLWQAHGNGVRCRACCHACRLEPGQSGRCGVRYCTLDGQNPVLYTRVADRAAAANLDPIEKKPLYHFMPGTLSWSFGTAGCNFSCAFCQNWSISRYPTEQAWAAANSSGTAASASGNVAGNVAGHSPDNLPDNLPGRPVPAAAMLAQAVAGGAASISFTYTEPAVFYEYMTNTADLAQQHGLACVLVSNGFFSPTALRELAPRIQAANIDLKSFSEAFYRDICGAKLRPVLRNLPAMLRLGWWLEITTLLIPGLNDSDAELRELARFIANNLGPDVPWHISRFRPEYRLRHYPPTPPATLERARDIGLDEGLRFVYVGNLPGHDANSTYCPHCGALFAKRAGFTVTLPQGAHCTRCGTSIPGIGWAQPKNSGHIC